MDMQDIRRANLAAWVRQHGGHMAAARMAGLKASEAAYLSACINGYSLGERSARNWERKLRLAAFSLDRAPEVEGSTPTESGSPFRSSGQNLALAVQSVAPTVSWEQLMTKPEELPAEFHVVLPDDAMAPRAPAGVKVKFNRDRAPQPGDAVLVAGPDGRPYFREYRLRLDGWEAHATNPAYPSLQSDANQLRVLAVFTGIDASWSSLTR